MALAGVLGVGGLVGWYFRETLKHLVPTPRHMAGLIRRRDLPPVEGTRFTVLVADLLDDDDDTQTRCVVAALAGADYRGLEVVRIGAGPEWRAGSRSDFEARAREVLTTKGGDVLIFGEVAKAGEKLRLQVIENAAAVDPVHRSYDLEKFELPVDFGSDFNAILVAVVHAVAPATERQGEYLAALLEPQAKKLQHLCAHMPASLDNDQRGSLWHAFGLAAGVLGKQKGENSWLEQAVTAFHEALKERTRERVPLTWAATQSNLGTTLKVLGERESGTARLHEAVAAYHEALKELTRERVPLVWAMTRNNVGTALQRLGERESGTARLHEAVAAYREALKELTRERGPLTWAGIQNNLATALATLGERESGTARLHEAVAALHAALEVFEPAGATHYAEVARSNLTRAKALLAERRRGAAAE